MAQKSISFKEAIEMADYILKHGEGKIETGMVWINSWRRACLNRTATFSMMKKLEDEYLVVKSKTK